MRRDVAIVLALSASVLGAAFGLAAADRVAARNPANDPSSPYYCPPGAKFCPAPGADNSIALDTHFGMDAKTGEVVAYRGNVHPDDILNPPKTGEQVLYTSPPISVENRYVPYPGAPQIDATGGTAMLTRTPPAAARNASRRDLVRERPASGRGVEARSEVANKQTARVDRRDNPTNGERIPWWKGGMWRNRKEPKPDTGRGGGSGSQPSPLSADDDMWDDDEYTGYNPDGSFGRQQAASGGDPYGPPQYGGDPYGSPQYGGDPYAGDPFAGQQVFNDPYASQGSYSSAPYSDPYASSGSTGGFVGDAYTLPNSPPPTSPYQQGYVYPGTDLSYESTGQGGYQPQPDYAASMGPPQSGGPFMPPPPGSPSPYQAPPAAPAESFNSPQFENAVRMVKDNRFSEAKGMLATETSRNPANAAAWRWLGDCHYNLLELDDAITSYQRALDRDPNDYYALRGQGFSYLHRGHEFWRRMQEEVARGQKEQAAATFAQAHENYKKSLELIGLCLRRAPNDGEAIYGEAMAAEGASRKLYSNAISYLKLGPENRERAELFAENCLSVINKGIDRSKERAGQSPGESGPRALLGGLYLRKAILYQQLGKNDLALIELKNAHDVQKSILSEIDKNNSTAQKAVTEIEAYWEAWGGNRQADLRT